GLIVTGTESNGSDGIELHSNKSRIKNTIIFNLDTGVSTAGINTQAIGVEIWIENCLIYGTMGRAAIQQDYFYSAVHPAGIHHIHNTLVYSNSNMTRAIYVNGHGASNWSNQVFEIINT